MVVPTALFLIFAVLWWQQCTVGVESYVTHLLTTTSLAVAAHSKLDKNSLYSSIPDSLGEVTTLVCLELDANQLEQTIPAALGSLPSLVTLVQYWPAQSTRICVRPAGGSSTAASYSYAVRGGLEAGVDFHRDVSPIREVRGIAERYSVRVCLQHGPVPCPGDHICGH